MSKTQRRARDALVGLLVALAPFAYKQFLAGNQYVAGVTLAVMGALALVYRYADARAMEAVAEGDVEELKPVLRRVGRRLRGRIGSDN